MENKSDPRLFQINKCLELLLKASHNGEDAQYLPGVLKWLIDVKAGMQERIDAEEKSEEASEDKNDEKE